MAANTKAKITKISVELAHPEHGNLKTVVECERDADFTPLYADLDRSARKNAASRFVRYESFGNDSAYLERLDEVAGAFVVKSMRLDTKEKPLRYLIDGQYSDEERGHWSDHVWAVSDEEADFVARQIMADNELASRSSPDDFQSTMEDILIHICVPEPVTKDELLSALKTEINLAEQAIATATEGEERRPDDDEWTTIRECAQDWLNSLRRIANAGATLEKESN